MSYRTRIWIGFSMIALGLAVSAETAFSAAPDLARGKATYKELCAICHGIGGRGDGAVAATLKTKPADLSDCTRMANFEDKRLFRAIKEGGAAIQLSKEMPSYSSSLDDAEIQDVVAFVRTLCVR